MASRSTLHEDAPPGTPTTMKTRRSTITRAAGLAATLLLGSCGGDPAEPRVVLIGIDSADWTIIDPLIEAGDMPNMARLKAMGAWGDLDTLTDIPLSPVVWTSVATGKVPAKHGVTWFLVDQPDGTRTPVRSTNRKTEALWTIADEAGKKAYSVGWWATYPAEILEHGIIASDALGFHGFGSTGRAGDDRGKVSPELLFPRLDALMPPEQQVDYGFVSRFVDVAEEDWLKERFDPAVSSRRNPYSPIHLFQQYAVTARGYTDIFSEFLEEDAYDLALCYFEQTDSFSHLFMKYEEPKLEWVDTRGFERYSRVVREWYRYQDELLGELLEHIDLETTAVVMVSDHGFKTGDRRIRSERTVDIEKAHLDHEKEGIFLAAGPGFAPGAKVTGASVLDVTPTLLHYLGLPVGKDMDGRVLTAAFEPDFAKEHPIRYVNTHEPGGGASPVVAEFAPASEGSRRDLEAGLRALGYLGADEGSPGPETVTNAPAAAAAEPGADASSPEILNNLGRIHLGRGEITEALAQFEAALELDPNNADALLAIGTVHQLQGRTEVAVRFAERALAVNPNSVGALSTLAGVRRDQGQLQDAARLYRTALAISDAHPGIHVGFGDVLLRSGNLEGARASFQSALELNPDERAAHYNLGVVHGELGENDEAMKRYERALELDPDHPQGAYALNNMGAIRREQGRDDEALVHFEDAAERLPGHLESRFNAAMIYRERGELGDAIARLEQAAAIEPNHELVQLQLGLARLESGATEDAYRSLLTVRRLYPRNWQAAIGLAVIEVAQGRVDEADALVTEALSLGRDGAANMARAYESLGTLPSLSGR